MTPQLGPAGLAAPRSAGPVGRRWSGVGLAFSAVALDRRGETGDARAPCVAALGLRPDWAEIRRRLRRLLRRDPPVTEAAGSP